MDNNVKSVFMPLNDINPLQLQVGDKIKIHGKLFTGRDAALPKLVNLIKEDKNPLNLHGSAIMHTAVSEAGISPTTSNKIEIEDSIGPLSRAGVKMHIGKGSLHQETVGALLKYDSVFVVTPPAAALLSNKIITKKVVAFPEEGIEAIHLLDVDGIPGIVAAAQGRTLNDIKKV